MKYFLDKTGREGLSMRDLSTGSNSSFRLYCDSKITGNGTNKTRSRLVVFAEKFINDSHFICNWVEYNYNVARPESHESFRELLLSNDFKELFLEAYTQQRCHESETKGELITCMTKEEAELFIKYMDVVAGDERTPLKRRYFRPDSRFIAEAKWATATAAEEGKTAILVMPEAEAVEIERRRGENMGTVKGG